jgi:Na+-translocating ferredoxin:NAD+ oxidoreductase subunit G
MGDIVKLCVILTAVCILNGLALGYVYDATKAAIEKTAEATLAVSLTRVVPRAEKFSEKKRAALPDGRALDYYEGFAPGGAVAGYALTAEKSGYRSLIKVLVGIDPAGTIQGIRVLEQDETPGLGTRIEEVAAQGTLWGRIAGLFGKGREKPAAAAEPWFQEQYRGLAPGDLKLLGGAEGGKGIHAITGATITSRALTDGVRESIEAFLVLKKEDR